MKKIKLIKFKKKYITKKYLTWLNDKNLMRFSEQRHKKHTAKTCLNYLNSFKNCQNEFLAVIDKENKSHIGNITLLIDKFNKLAFINILIGIPNQGYGKSAFKETVNYLKKKYKLRKIICGTMSINKPMIKLLYKNNFKLYFRIKKYYLLNNLEVDLVYYYLQVKK